MGLRIGLSVQYVSKPVVIIAGVWSSPSEEAPEKNIYFRI